MKVSELIEKLKEMPQDYEVMMVNKVEDDYAVFSYSLPKNIVQDPKNNYVLIWS